MVYATPIVDYDIIFLSYDEPNAEHNWADLLSKWPRAKRVHDVVGFDAAHKECARVSETERFITVDGDNIVDPSFFETSLADNGNYRRVYSWSSRNVVNDLAYGNGGIKCWTKRFVNEMRTHEIADHEHNKLDFCWYADQKLMSGIYSTSMINTTPYQAWRAGFREGVKMCLLDGKRVDVQTFRAKVNKINRDRLSVWCSIGSDVENGHWAVYGAQLGCISMLLDTNFDPAVISNFDRLRQLYESYRTRHNEHERADYDGGYTFDDGIRTRIRNDLRIPIADFSPAQSSFYKKVRVPTRDELIEGAR